MEKDKEYVNQIIQEKYDDIKKTRRKKNIFSYHEKPGIEDPKLFMIKVKIGTEQETALGLMKKYFDLRGKEDEI